MESYEVPPGESSPTKLLVELAIPVKIHIVADNLSAQVQAQRIAAVIEKPVPDLLDLAASAK